MRAVSITAKTLIAAVFLIEGCARAPKREGDLKAVRAEILAIEKQWASAIERQDAAAFERLAAEEFRFIDENGRVLNRAQYIADRSHNPDNVESAVQDEIEVRQYGDSVLATGRLDYSWDAGWSAICVSLSLDGCVCAAWGAMASCLGSIDYAVAVG